MKKKPKLTITAQKFQGIIASYALEGLTRDELVAVMKSRGIPVPKLKHLMASRIVDYVLTNAIPVTVTIG